MPSLFAAVTVSFERANGSDTVVAQQSGAVWLTGGSCALAGSFLPMHLPPAVLLAVKKFCTYFAGLLPGARSCATPTVAEYLNNQPVTDE